MAATLVLVGYFLWQYLELRRENKELLRNKEQLTRRYAETNEKLIESQRILERLRTDPEFVEMFIRRRLGYAKPDELIYNFDLPPAPDPLLLPPPPEPPPPQPPPRQQPPPQQPQPQR
ncbi:MAG: septum formation initiator family protein [Opitutaceae bacterium]|nr:septum formation initiator family protein [Opitutaceae bacterium]